MPYPSHVDPDQLGAHALALVEAKGWDHWSLRDVAAAIGVTPNALYRYVDGKAGLDVAAGVAAARDLRAALDAPRLAADPVDAAVEVAARYLGFGIDRPEAYRAFMEAKPGPTDPLIIEWMHLWATIHGVVSRVVPDAADAAAFTLWAFVHGRIELARGAARLAGPDDGFEVGVRAILVGFGEMGVVESPLPPDLRELTESIAADR